MINIMTEEKFVRVLEPDVCPQTRWVEGSNLCGY